MADELEMKRKRLRLLQLQEEEAAASKKNEASSNDTRIQKAMEADPAAQVKSLIESVGNRVMSIPGAVTKAGTLGTLAQLKDLYTGKDDTQYLKEGLEALTGKGVPSAEYYKRLGAPEGTATNVAGGITDFGADLVGGYGASKGIQSIGASMRKVPYSKMDAILRQNEQMPISDILKEAGKDKAITHEGVMNNIQSVLDKTTGERNALEAPVISSGETGSMKEALSAAQNRANALKNSGDSGYQELGYRLQKEIDKRLAMGERPAIPSTKKIESIATGLVDEAGNPIMRESVKTIPGSPAQPGPTYSKINDVKRFAGDQVGDFYNRLPPEEDKFWKAVGGGSRSEGYSIANKVEPGLGNKIAQKNTRISSMLSSLPTAERKAVVEATKNPVSEIDALLALAEPMALAGKTIGKGLKTPAPWTYGGAALENIGKFGKKATIPASVWLEYNRLKEGDNQ